MTQQEVVPPLPPLALPLVSPRWKSSIWLLVKSGAPPESGVHGCCELGPSPFRKPTPGRPSEGVRCGRAKVVPAGSLEPFGGHVRFCPGGSPWFSAQLKLNWLPRSAKNGSTTEPQDPVGHV